VPSCRTDDPLAPVATVVPIAVRSYFTVALVAESSVTESTLELTAAASGLAANVESEEENCEPFSSRLTRSLFGVAELKNLFQLVVISATAADEPVAVPEAADDVAADDGAAAEVVAAGAGDEELEPLEQADSAAVSMRPSAGARQIRRVMGLIRIVTRPFGRRPCAWTS
jgi:hypothetical protein